MAIFSLLSIERKPHMAEMTPALHQLTNLIFSSSKVAPSSELVAVAE